MRLSKKLTILLIVLGTVIIMPNSAHAAFQSVPEQRDNRNVDDFFVGCRQMETSGGALGLNENLNEDYTGSTENGIDAHMALNTEWGTAALLTNSIYGAGEGISGANNSSTSTGNATGIYGLADNYFEITANICYGIINDNYRILAGSNQMYFNAYADITSKAGDALECLGWLGNSSVIYPSNYDPMFVHAFGGLFGIGKIRTTNYTRAVVVCAEGL